MNPERASEGGRIRLFVAVDPGDAMRQEITRAIDRVRHRSPDAKWISGENVHVTLAFLGYQDQVTAAPIASAIAGVAARHPPMHLGARGAGTFGPQQRPRVLWTALSGELEVLASVRAEVERALAAFDYEPEARAFHPHLTLARSRSPGGDSSLVACAAALADADFGSATIAELILFKSDLSPAGARYSALARCPLSRTVR